MGGINVRRWILGGILAGAVIWVLEGVASVLYMEEMRAAMAAHGLSMEMSAGVWGLSIAVSLLVGLVTIFFYAAARPRFGAGPRTAILVAVALWVGGYLVTLLGYQMLVLFPPGMLATWGVVGLVEMPLAALAGAWVYREQTASTPGAGRAAT